MAKSPLRRVKADKLTFKSLPVIWTFKSLARAMVEEDLGEELPNGFADWPEFESDRHCVFLDPKVSVAGVVRRRFGELEARIAERGSRGKRGTGGVEPISFLHGGRSGEDLIAVIIDKSAVGARARQVVQTLARHSPRSLVLERVTTAQRRLAEKLLVGELWDSADDRGFIHFWDHHGRAVLRKPALARQTSSLADEFEASGCPFLEIAEYVCRAVQLTEFYERTWKGKVKSGFQSLTPQTRQHLGAAVGAITAADSPFTASQKKQLATWWDQAKRDAEDRHYLNALEEAKREIGSDLLTKTDSGEHKSARPVITGIVLTVVDQLLATKRVSKHRACDLTDRLLLLLVSDWYDHENPRPDRVRSRYEYNKTKRRRRHSRRKPE